MSEDARGPLSRKLRVETIGDGTSGTVEATKEEMAAVASLLELVALERLAFAYRLVPAGGHRIRLTGKLTASVVQTCVVSLDPVASDIDLPAEIEFWPEGSVVALEKSAEADPGASVLEWPEPIEDGTIDLGPVVYETLATSLDPYPKKAGVSFEWSQGGGEEAALRASGPFAALDKLKRG